MRFGGAKGPDNTEWHSIAAAGGESRHLTIPEKFEPLGFTRDGSALYGTFEMNKMAQLATLALAPAGTPTSAAATPLPLTALPRGVNSAVISPGGSQYDSAVISPDGSHYAILADPRLPDPLSDVHTVIEAEPTSAPCKWLKLLVSNVLKRFATLAFAPAKLSYQKVAGIALLIYPRSQHCGAEV